MNRSSCRAAVTVHCEGRDIDCAPGAFVHLPARTIARLSLGRRGRAALFEVSGPRGGATSPCRNTFAAGWKGGSAARPRIPGSLNPSLCRRRLQRRRPRVPIAGVCAAHRASRSYSLSFSRTDLWGVYGQLEKDPFWVAGFAHGKASFSDGSLRVDDLRDFSTIPLPRRPWMPLLIPRRTRFPGLLPRPKAPLLLMARPTPPPTTTTLQRIRRNSRDYGKRSRRTTALFSRSTRTAGFPCHQTQVAPRMDQRVRAHRTECLRRSTYLWLALHGLWIVSYSGRPCLPDPWQRSTTAPCGCEQWSGRRANWSSAAPPLRRRQPRQERLSRPPAPAPGSARRSSSPTTAALTPLHRRRSRRRSS